MIASEQESVGFMNTIKAKVPLPNSGTPYFKFLPALWIVQDFKFYSWTDF